MQLLILVFHFQGASHSLSGSVMTICGMVVEDVEIGAVHFSRFLPSLLTDVDKKLDVRS